MIIILNKKVFLKMLLNVLFFSNSGQSLHSKTKVRLTGNSRMFVNPSRDLVVQFNACQQRSNLFLIMLIADTWGYILFLFLLLLIFWFYRRYEIKKLKHHNHFHKDENQEIFISEKLHQPESEIKFGQCLTGLYEKRDCLFYNSENLIWIEDGENDWQEPATVDLLLSKINADIFCNRSCREKRDYSFSSESKLEQHLVMPSKHSNCLNYPVKSFSFFNHNPQFQKGDTPLSPIDEEFILKTERIIEANYSDYMFTAEHLASELNMSMSQVNRKLNSLTGGTAGHLISTCRLQHASEFLIQNTDTITDICFSSGYNGSAYFSRAFKKEFGCTPSVYRKLMTKKSISVRK